MSQKNKISLSWKKKLFFSLFILGILFLFTEWISQRICHARFTLHHTKIGIQGNSRWIDDPVLIWSNRPFYLEFDQSSQYNDHGMRVATGDVFMPPKTKEDFWVFLLGGSAMAGMGSAQGGDWLKITGISTHSIENSIDGQLEEILQKALPQKKVRVFNASVASSTLIQSKLRYEYILRHLKPDWVISMDGMNDLGSLPEGETSYQWHRKNWAANKVHHFPFAQGRFLMRNSALFYLLGEYLFFRSGIIRTPLNSDQDKDIFKYWLNQKTPTVNPSSSSPNPVRERAVQDFLRNLELFHQTLKYDKQKHLLLVQPCLNLRNPKKVKGVEKALYNYLNSNSHPFLDSVHQFVQKKYANTPQVQSMDQVHQWEEWVFVDYCHFTKQANQRIAEELKAFILSKEEIYPFSPQFHKN